MTTPRPWVTMLGLVRGDGSWGTDAPGSGGNRMRIAVNVVFTVWLLIGAVAAGQRHYFADRVATCDLAGTVAVTIAAGPLNYHGVDPVVSCPQPS